MTQIKEKMLGEGEELQATGGKIEIIKLKNIQYLILKERYGNDFSYKFYSESNNHKRIEGSLLFKKHDKDSAEKIFLDLLKSITFKK